MSKNRTLVALKQTLVVYDESSLLSWLLAIITLSPIFLYVAEACFILFRREYFGLTLILGQLINEIVNVALKEIIAEPRPSPCEQSEYGMPSAHSQAMFFVTSCVIVTLSRRRHKPLSDWEKNFLYLFLITCSLLVCFSRVYLGYHSVAQVIVGALVGCVVGYFWTLCFQEGNGGLLSLLKSVKALKMMYFKDSLECCHFLRREQLQCFKCEECTK